MDELFSPLYNFKNYKDALDAAEGPKFPYFGNFPHHSFLLVS